MNQRVYRDENNISLTSRIIPNNVLPPNDCAGPTNSVDLNCLMPDVMFHHHQSSIPANHPLSNSFQNQAIGSPQRQPVNTSDIHSNAISRKRRFSQFNTGQEFVDNIPQPISSNLKRTPIVTIKPEPGKQFYIIARSTQSSSLFSYTYRLIKPTFMSRTNISNRYKKCR